ncbi:MAG: RNA polymerase sigma factor [Phycisphaerales bacterium]|nr:RNA polymerase sigma factor [Phycisphaerales bacterium]
MTDLPREQLEEALRNAADGDQRAWRLIVDHYSARVFGLLRAHCGNADLAEEITQSTFCTIAAKIGSYVESGRFEAWLFRIAMNRLRDEMRRRKRQATPADQQVLSRVAPVEEGGGHVEAAATAGEIAALRGALGSLNDADQRVVHLRHAAGLSFRQIADLLEEPLGTILARHHRALRKLRDLLETPSEKPPD